MSTSTLPRGDSPLSKRPKLSSSTSPLIGTHSGHFHADEALAVFLLRLLPAYHTSPLVRTRDASILTQCDVVVDVGGEYDAVRHRYDHHQREFTTTFPGRATKLSSAGLVWLHFGRAIVAAVTGLEGEKEAADVETLFQRIYTEFVEAFDANDNGISVYDTAALTSASIAPRFSDRGFSLASAVNRFNHTWSLPESAPFPSIPPSTPACIAPSSLATPDPDAPAKETEIRDPQATEDSHFLHASTFVGTQFLLALHDAHKAWLPARALVRAAYANRKSVHPSGKVLELPHRDGGLPWADHLYEVEAEASEAEGSKEGAQVLYVLFPESGAADSKWRIRSVSVQNGGFVNRKDLPDGWKGVRDGELEKVSGVEGAVFVHASGFIGGAKTREGVKEMARLSVEA
ncbi:putative UPF0160 domain protein MYG1 [Eremomyces bilateralis CBS 781.70]|uniref:UPF0160 domain protein MYG1 n=1 Tax=Eremomyces bilateralis CBS 781.70 TaxID=1392243 RepID=A0A6G1FZM6_9PEZI|nr:putative UPF0160 domain protein MYG1 [Eremomyces bilateralis CBS 781.70]KAF1811120.1 putative UPF0160 domain protein MYG1 [Eremomyces bilateralis CBS 781.70]